MAWSRTDLKSERGTGLRAGFPVRPQTSLCGALQASLSAPAIILNISSFRECFRKNRTILMG